MLRCDIIGEKDRNIRLSIFHENIYETLITITSIVSLIETTNVSGVLKFASCSKLRAVPRNNIKVTFHDCLINNWKNFFQTLEARKEETILDLRLSLIPFSSLLTDGISGPNYVSFPCEPLLAQEFIRRRRAKTGLKFN